jgi:hypothetical protein
MEQAWRDGRKLRWFRVKSRFRDAAPTQSWQGYLTWTYSVYAADADVEMIPAVVLLGMPRRDAFVRVSHHR